MTTTGEDPRALDKLSARTGGVLSQLVLDHSPVMFRCGFGAEDMVVLDLIGRYRFPIKVITTDAGMSAEAAARLRAFAARRYVFAVPVVDVHDDRLQDLGVPSTGEARDWLAVVFSGCRAWVSAARGDHAASRGSVAGLHWDAACECMRCNVLADWRAADVRAYLERWELPTRESFEFGTPRAA